MMARNSSHRTAGGVTKMHSRSCGPDAASVLIKRRRAELLRELIQLSLNCTPRPRAQALAATQHPVLATFEDLPPSVHLSIILLLPRLVDRVRVALVSKWWAALLSEPAVWAELSFEDARPEHLSAEVYMQLARRAAGRLRSLDLSHPLPTWQALLAAMAAEDLNRNLKRFTASTVAFTIRNAEGALALRSACPALTIAAVHVRADWRGALAAMRALGDCGAESTADFIPARYLINLLSSSAAGLEREEAAALDAAAALEREDDFTSFATALAETLGRCRIKSLAIGIGEDSSPFWVDYWDLFHSPGPDQAAAEHAAASLCAALAHPLRGPRELRVRSRGFLAAAHVIRALTAQSPLRALTLGEEVLDGDALRELTAALAPGRTRLEELQIDGEDVGSAEGCVPAHRFARPPSVLCEVTKSRLPVPHDQLTVFFPATGWPSLKPLFPTPGPCAASL